jgi:hypothetical protein
MCKIWNLESSIQSYDPLVRTTSDVFGFRIQPQFEFNPGNPELAEDLSSFEEEHHRY